MTQDRLVQMNLMGYLPFKVVKNNYVLYKTDKTWLFEYSIDIVNNTFTLDNYIDENLLELGYIKEHDYTRIINRNFLTFYFKNKVRTDMSNILDKYFTIINNGIDFDYYLSLI